MGNVNYKIVGNADDAVRAVDKLRSQFEKLEMKMKDQAKFSRQNKAATQESMASQAQFVRSMVVEIFSLQGAWKLAQRAVGDYIQASQNVNARRDQVAPNAKETEIKLKNQGQLNDAETKQTIENANREATAIPVSDVTDAKRITEEAFSQGFERQQVINGEVLRAFLELKAATNQYGAGAEDSKRLVASLAGSFRNTEGRDAMQAITAEEIRSFGEAFHSLFLTQSIQLQDMIPFARIQAILSARGIDNKTQLAAFSVAVDAFSGGETAATYLQQATAYMGRGGSEKMRKKLDKLGIELDGTKFDLIGEDLVEALRNMREQLNALPPREKQDALDALFGTKAQAGALTLMGKADVIQKSRTKIEKATEGGGYQQAFENFRVSPQANAQAIANREEIGAIEGLKSQKDMTQEMFDKIMAATYAELKKQNGSSLNLISDKIGAHYSLMMKGNLVPTPYELLSEIEKLSTDRARYNIEAGRPNADAIQTAKIFSREIDKADPRTMQMQHIPEGVETADQMPYPVANDNNAAPDQWKVDLWNEYDVEKRKIEKQIREQHADSITSWMGGLGGNPIHDYFHPEQGIKNEIDAASQPLYEQYRERAEAGPQNGKRPAVLPPGELPAMEFNPPSGLNAAERQYSAAVNDLENGPSAERFNALTDSEKALEQQLPQGKTLDQYKEDILNRSYDEQRPSQEIRFPENMNVQDAPVLSAIRELNTTMTNIEALLSQGPDRQRSIKLPRQNV